MLPNIGFPEMIFVIVLVLLLFGAKRLPEIGASMGKGIREFKRSISDVDKSIKEPEPRSRIDRYGSDGDQNRQADDADAARTPKRLIS